MIRAVRRVLVATLVAAAMLMLLPTAAAVAGPFGCEPESPTPAFAGDYVNPPEPIPPAGAGFQGTEYSQFDLYGITGYRYHMYDLGCGPNVVEHATSGNVNGMANHMLAGAQMFIGWAQSVTEAAFNPEWMNVFDQLMRNLTAELHQQVFLKWSLVAAALAGIVLLAGTVRRGDVTGAATRVGAAVAIIAVVTFAAEWPVKLGNLADRTITGTVDYVAASVTGQESAQGAADQVGSTLVHNVLYQQWLRGSLGPGNVGIQQKYGNELFAAQVLDWQEARNYRTGSDQERDDILKEHKQQWEDAANGVQDANPYAYEHLTGKQADTRFGSAFFALVGSFFTAALLILTGILVIFALLAIRLAVIMVPLVGLLALASPTNFGAPLWNLIDRWVAGPLLQATAAGITAVLYIPIMSVVITAGQVPWWLRFVLLFAMFIATWLALKPLRKLSRGASHFTQTGREMGQAAAGWPGRTAGYAKDAGRFVTRTAAGAAVGGYVGGYAASAGYQAHQDKPQQDPQPDQTAPAAEPTEPAAPTRQRELHQPTAGEIKPASYGGSNGTSPNGGPRQPDDLIPPGQAPPDAPVIDPDEFGTYQLHDPRKN